MYSYAQLDPRNIPAASIANDATLASGAPVLGVEVTVAALAARCTLGNLDHHGPESTTETPSACEQALTCELPADGAVLATVRCDADSVTAMAVLASRLADRKVSECLVRAIGEMDRLGPKSGSRHDAVIAVARKSSDFRVALEERVAWVQSVLDGTCEATEIALLKATRDLEFEMARIASSVVVADEKVAVVVLTLRFATNLGYEVANVVVAMNPEFPVDTRDPAKGTCRKFTVARYDSHVPCDIKTALAELNALEPGWGGQGDIIGSPQGQSSILVLSQVIDLVLRAFRQ